eukprot:scaffold165681_cov29-Tisochrysis_lutea.AAC.1
MAREAHQLSAWLSRAPARLDVSQLEFVLAQPVRDCAAALPAIEQRLAEVRNNERDREKAKSAEVSEEGETAEVRDVRGEREAGAKGALASGVGGSAADEAAHLAFIVEIIRERINAEGEEGRKPEPPASAGQAEALTFGDKGPESADTRPICQFGTACYRRNPQHLRDFRHDIDPPVLAPKPNRAAKAGKGGKRKRRKADTDTEHSSNDHSVQESDWEDEPVQLMPSKLRARRKRVNYAEMDEPSGGGAESSEGVVDEDDAYEDEEPVSHTRRATVRRTVRTRDSQTMPVGDDSVTEEEADASDDRANQHGASAHPVEWTVLLGRSFRPYDRAVSRVIEEAYARRDLIDEVEIEVRGTKYVVVFSTMRQELKSDPSRWREVQRRT